MNVISNLLIKSRLKKKIYPDNEAPDQKNGECYRKYNKGTRAVIYKGSNVYEMASAGGPGGWGNHIAWSTCPTKTDGVKGSIVGFSRRFPKVGELVVSRLQSGRYFYCAIMKVEPCGNPHDMFFADIEVVLAMENKITGLNVMN